LKYFGLLDMKLGKFTIDLLDTGVFALDGGAMFGVIPKPLWSKAYNPGDEKNRIPLAARPMLIQWEDRKLLIDTGNGIKLNEKLSKIYGIDTKKSAVDYYLGQFGIDAAEITDVILTHLHFDHAGGATVYENGTAVPAFKNAKYYIQKEHYLWAKNPTEKDRASFMSDNYEPLVAGGMLEFIDGEGELFPGITLLPLFGHTKAMQAVKIDGGEQVFLYAADLCPTSAHVPVPYVMGYDNFPLTSMEEKRRIFSEAYEDGWIIVYEHDAFKQATVIDANEKGFYAGQAIEITGKK
jgi:glyoxylase-like metal-dependent hydrolase (beta-lactamase superfamily II)